jgi:hypothetical protein
MKKPKSEYDFCECVANDRHAISYPRRAASDDQSEFLGLGTRPYTPVANPHSASPVVNLTTSGATMTRDPSCR